jgi:hypothetical protein
VRLSFSNARFCCTANIRRNGGCKLVSRRLDAFRSDYRTDLQAAMTLYGKSFLINFVIFLLSYFSKSIPFLHLEKRHRISPRASTMRDPRNPTRTHLINHTTPCLALSALITMAKPSLLRLHARSQSSKPIACWTSWLASSSLVPSAPSLSHTCKCLSPHPSAIRTPTAPTSQKTTTSSSSCTPMAATLPAKAGI